MCSVTLHSPVCLSHSPLRPCPCSQVSAQVLRSHLSSDSCPLTHTSSWLPRCCPSWCWCVVFLHPAHHWSPGLPLLCWPPLQLLRGLLFPYSSQSVLDVLPAQASVGTEQSYSCLCLQRHCAPRGLSHLCTNPFLCIPEPNI